VWTTSARRRETLSALGLLEARPIRVVAGGDRHVRLLNPLAENEAPLRRSLLESLARRAEFNLSHMQGNVRLYEIGTAFAQGDPLPDETMNVALLIMGDRDPAHFAWPPATPFDAWDAKAFAERVARIAYPSASIELQPLNNHAELLWLILVDGDARGEVRRLFLDAPVWAKPAFGVELLLGAMPNGDVAPPGEHAHGAAEEARVRTTRPYRPLPATPAAEFDLALLLPAGVLASQVERTIRAAAGDLLERIELFDLYEGAGIDEGHRSVAWRLTLRHPERTLRDKEIEGRRKQILAALQITSELFQEREANHSITGALHGLSAEVRRMLPPAKRGEGTMA
jgi:phenylalanyl-tRNA synthetase beta chain